MSNAHWKVGESYFIRTVSFFHTGKLVSVDEHEIVLVDAAWIADTGRFADCFKTGRFSEVEPYPDGVSLIIGRGAIVDACIWSHPLPRDQI